MSLEMCHLLFIYVGVDFKRIALRYETRQQHYFGEILANIKFVQFRLSGPSLCAIVCRNCRFSCFPELFK